MEFFNLELSNEVAGIVVVKKGYTINQAKVSAKLAKEKATVQNKKDPILGR